MHYRKLSNNRTIHHEAHQNVFVSLRAQPCSNVHAVHEEERCVFVQETEECRESMHYFDYMYFMYCIIDSSNMAVFGAAIIALLLVVLYIGVIIHSLCVNYYVGSVLYVAKTWSLNEYTAGITLLTYGNGLSQVLSELKHHTSEDTELIYNQYLGTAVYQASFLAALVTWTRRFYIYPEVIVPNIITLMIVALLVEGIMFDEEVGIFQTAILGVLYVAFLSTLYTVTLMLDRERNRSRSQIEVRDVSGKLFDISLTETASTVENYLNTSWSERTWRLFRTFRNEDYRAASCGKKLYLLCNMPTDVIAVLLLPRVNYELPLHGWNRWLCIMNVNFYPLFLISTAMVDLFSFYELSWACLGSLVASMTLSLAICISTRDDLKPPFFDCIGIFAVFGTSYLVMLLSYEMIAILETLSIIANISTASFVITILSWGSCWIDLVTLTTLAKRGYPRLAFAACLGAPVFNILIGLCTVFSVQMIRAESTTIHVRDGTSGPTSSAYLFIISLTILLLVLITHFRASFSLSLCMMMLYLTYLLFIALCELEITHGYGTDHNDDGEYFQDQVPQHIR
ncbi:mitochondrial sodium/calcium exchanger protein-like [Anopheles nili]|uniref:mitochondrial sodium/calcium exchanger protein-like n=1 Tax=Anopheles nili TaxID=185578 RepID=UPI00237BD9D6|nr:mitochondrial sodium/calcium exchanger protein-like [Anopheles nili]